MLIEKSGDILTSSANIICQQVNCKGVMGAGLAKQIRSKYPRVYTEYKTLCDNMTVVLLGQVIFTQVEANKWVACIFGQDGYGRTGEVFTNYAALENGLQYIRSESERCGFKVAIPKEIGCGLAGGDKNIVLDMLKRVFENSSVEVELWTYVA